MRELSGAAVRVALQCYLSRGAQKHIKSLICSQLWKSLSGARKQI